MSPDRIEDIGSHLDVEVRGHQVQAGPAHEVQRSFQVMTQLEAARIG